MKKAFTMIELVFVIVVIGILASVAAPRLAATRDDAEITAALSTIGSVRSAMATERQLRILRGDFTAITSLNADGGAFSTFSADNAKKSNSVLEGTIPTCATATTNGCWRDGLNYAMPTSGKLVTFEIANGSFKCKTNCSLLSM